MTENAPASIDPLQAAPTRRRKPPVVTSSVTSSLRGWSCCGDPSMVRRAWTGSPRTSFSTPACSAVGFLVTKPSARSVRQRIRLRKPQGCGARGAVQISLDELVVGGLASLRPGRPSASRVSCGYGWPVPTPLSAPLQPPNSACHSSEHHTVDHCSQWAAFRALAAMMSLRVAVLVHESVVIASGLRLLSSQSQEERIVVFS